MNNKDISNFQKLYKMINEGTTTKPKAKLIALKILNMIATTMSKRI